MTEVYKDIAALKKEYKVKSVRLLPDGYIALRKDKIWYYFNYDLKLKGLVQTGSSLKLMK